MTLYLQSGTSYVPRSEENLVFHKTLPAGNFIIQKNPMNNEFYFEKVDIFKPDSTKTYGDVDTRADRFIRSYNERPGSTGVLLVGEKGSGKSKLAKVVCHKLHQQGVPTIIVNRSYDDERFLKLFQDIQQDCVILFDEFEKTFDRKEQDAILTLLDGVFPTRKMFIFTANDSTQIGTYFMNRPSRILYLVEFDGISPEFIEEFCRDNLDADCQKYLEKFIDVSQYLPVINFDMLQSWVQEVNRFKEEPAKALEMLNIRPASSNSVYFKVSIFDKAGKSMEDKTYHGSSNGYSGSPLTADSIKLYAAYSSSTTEDDDPYLENDSDSIPLRFLPGDIVECVNDTITMVNKDGYKVIFARSKNQKFSFNSLLS